ncbi:MAG: aminotransferase class I/II-fold pyridoxal phosphate-dependent enzyme, partial [Eubacteriales bacterium]|nr:aminotransferase class I/II-fold pyridoxal phosphate-dependent enzyme [Eubacteriales bacterium]
MLHKINPENSFATNVLEAGAYFNNEASNPEQLPIHMATAHNVEDCADLLKRYEKGDYCYNRYRNPNREALGELMSYVEGGEFSLACSSGMGSIFLAIMSNVQEGDHIVYDKVLYGESIEIFTKILSKFGVTSTPCTFTDLDSVKAAVQPNTKLFYGETVCNPLCAVADLKAISDIAHENGAILVIDNTFMTGALAQPLKLGADLVVNSLTKFANGHSDAVVGCITGPKDMVMKCHANQQLVGSQADPFSSWLVCRGLRTLDLRVKKQADNAKALAEFFEESPYVKRVFY